MTQTDIDRPAPAADASLRGRLAARREELQKREPFFVPVPGYEDVLQAKYHAVDYRTLRRIGMRQADNQDQPEGEINVAADTLVTACDGLFEVPEEWSGKPEDLVPTGHAWGVKAAWELFGVPAAELPEGSTSRAALLRIIPDHTEVVLHYAEVDRRSRAVNRGVGKALEGESVAGSAEA